MTSQLSQKERNEIWEGLANRTYAYSSLEKRIEAFKKAAEKFSLKMKISGKGTYEERYTLNTDYTNCDDVQDYIFENFNVGIGVISGKVTFKTSNCI